MNPFLSNSIKPRMKESQQSKENESNRNLLIIGNGFDLANGLKSSFQQFIHNYMFTIHKELSCADTYEDENVKISGGNVKSDFKDTTPFSFLDIYKTEPEYSIDWSNKFLENIANQSYSDNSNWADFEYAYFKMIDDQIKIDPKEKAQLSNNIDDLNTGLELLTSQFCKYLSDEQNRNNSELTDNPLKTEKIKQQMRSVLFPKQPDKMYDQTCVINFNYTSIFEPYIPEEIQNYFHLHGKLEDPENSPIIGFGDDYHVNHKKFQDLNMNSVFRFSKSRHYLKNTSYRKISKWLLDTKDYDVHIFGHSCGLTDRTLLKEIFTRENCKNIKIYYYKDEDGYFETALNISRHFDDPADYRLKVVPLGESESCEQVSSNERT
jgi:hypothetical protein